MSDTNHPLEPPPPPGIPDRVVRALVTVALIGGAVLFLALNGPRDGWAWSRVWGDANHAGWRPLFLSALGKTLLVSVGALLLSLIFGGLGGLARLSPRPAINQIAVVYVEVVRGTPLLVQIFLAVYCVGYSIGLDGDPTLVGVFTLGLFAGAYVTEIVRSAVESIDRGQTEAALSQGMTRGQVLRHVLLPQAFRRMLPPMTGEFVSLVKDSSLLSVVGVLEISKRASEARADTYRTYEIYVPLAILYLAITFPLSRLARRLELRLASQ